METRQNNTYYWFCSIEPEYYRSKLRPGLYACGGIAVFILVFGGVMAYMFDDVTSFFIVAACAVVYMLITALVFGLAMSAKDPRESYEMTDTNIKTGSGRSSEYFDFKKIRQITFTRKYIEIKGKVRRMRIYTPTEEELDFVRGYIMNRLPGDVEMKYE